MAHSEDHLRDLLKEVYDPELGVNIVDLGLVYEVRDEPERIYVKMTLTTPGCPMHDTIAGGVKWVLAERTGKEDVNVDIVWEPKWSPRMMSMEAKEMLGFF
ncbi:aromatic ring hydroxylase [Cohnella sp. CIP 111063]|jgi:Predicted metal-sulfur cluster biosynthetic enzyme|uniref:metal-sulfur cluster assembly factor n=1 Tax=unclassified Cohnella TaxID=2636738 RepID=UPI000B8BC97D|nr:MULTISPECIES: metal-sulfur cluster assembly factor [unclassified Cohnella]OXS61091.1 aromatic ring hydroxylase [Cohnella sp. CIP 111063]PRX73638.1 metal-sulfur cluster biosynthetic enzyme [Cohnella sp. SGD-V74]